MFDNVRGGIEWAQSLSTLPKGVISLVVVLVCGLILVILWQKPAEIAAEKQASGNTNQSGNAASSGQSGGVTAGLYIINQAPPVTAQQKEEALLRHYVFNLRSRNWLSFQIGRTYQSRARFWSKSS